MAQDSALLIKVREALSFFDEKPSWSRGHATAAVAVLGEDLAAACLQRCLESNGSPYVNVRSETVGTGPSRGPRLDRWIEADLCDCRKVLFQTEIKSWSAHAIGGKILTLDASHEEVKDYEHRYWEGQWDAEHRTLTHDYVGKALVRMKPKFDTQQRHQLPLIIYWAPVSPDHRTDFQPRAAGGHLFSIANPSYEFPFTVPASWPNAKGQEFTELWIFSVSSYLRSIEEDLIELNMPIAASRMRALNRIVVPDDG